jgi:hypothetical protein
VPPRRRRALVSGDRGRHPSARARAKAIDRTRRQARDIRASACERRLPRPPK